MFENLRSLLGFESKADNNINLRATKDTKRIVESIRKREEEDPTSGNKIFSMDYGEFSILLDREFTGRYRISVFREQHKVYGFTISDKKVTDDQFEQAWDHVLTFLEDPSPADMPENKLMETHFFGHPK